MYHFCSQLFIYTFQTRKHQVGVVECVTNLHTIWSKFWCGYHYPQFHCLVCLNSVFWGYICYIESVASQSLTKIQKKNSMLFFHFNRIILWIYTYIFGIDSVVFGFWPLNTPHIYISDPCAFRSMTEITQIERRRKNTTANRHQITILDTLGEIFHVDRW